MDASQPGVDAFDSPSPEEVRSELRRILADPEFQRNANSSRFLKFIVEETLEGRGARLKAFTIATLALQRSEDFNPQSNSIVRVQAMRLRELLDDYYADAGAGDAVEIRLQRGVYQPEFLRRTSIPAAATGTAASASAKPSAVGPKASASRAILSTSPEAVAPIRSRGPLLGLLAMATLALIGLVAAVRLSAIGVPTAEIIGPPVVVVLPPELLGNPAGASLPSRFLNAIESGLSAFDHMTVRGAGSAKTTYDYAVAGRFLETTPGRFDIDLRLLRGVVGDVVWSRRYIDIDAQDGRAVAALERLAVIMIGDVGGGAVFADVRARLATQHAPLTGFACVMASFEFARERQEKQRAATRNCLETELDSNPDDVGALTGLATILTINYLNDSPDSRGASDLTRALQLASRAYDIAPQRAEAQTAVFFTRFYNRQFGDAFRMAREAALSNPNSSALMSRIARAYISREAYDDGFALIAPFETANSGPPASLLAPLAIAALMRGEGEKALVYSERTVAALSPLGLAIRIVTCHESGDIACVAAASDQLRNDYPGFAKDIPAALSRHCYSDSIRERLLKGLADAGWTAKGAATEASHAVEAKP